MHLKGIPRDVGDCIDRSLCGYSNFFPKISCILRTCNECGTEFYKDSVAQNAEKMKDKHKRFMVKLSICVHNIRNDFKKIYKAVKNNILCP